MTGVSRAGKFSLPSRYGIFPRTAMVWKSDTCTDSRKRPSIWLPRYDCGGGSNQRRYGWLWHGSTMGEMHFQAVVPALSSRQIVGKMESVGETLKARRFP